jgi:hypothetical protein
MALLQKLLNQRSIGDRERQFYSHSLQYLSTQSGRQVQLESWMITSHEVERGEAVGSGGLYVFSRL